ncbi:hypothetical protein [Halococcoides cellulosivorans]|uniref:Dna2/Cas4 domain-containing protein n=1 Tax=Halococcoides cellulosivorans TaxID=1679096 RepID=A0A2R4WZ61_9EURY|nr:hypothetical protein [Halococcoides cellulosivorans]AWB26833.1 hypothetical protein HARCEL1_03425 [Halococcoides cellulosivorans]
MPSFRDLERAAYCPRQQYYHERRDAEPTVPERVTARRAIAFEYERLLADRVARREAPLAVDPAVWRERMDRARERCDRFADLVDPPATEVYIEGSDAGGIVHKLLTDPPEPVLVSAGTPPETGVYDPQSVRATAAAQALADREGPVEHATVEYPAVGRIRRIAIGARRRGRYREVCRTVAAMEDPPPRIDSTSKCEACEFQETCGTPTRSVRSLLGL